MDVLQLVFIIGISLAIISIIFTLYYLFSFISNGGKLKHFASKQTKNRKKMKKQAKQIEQMKKKNRKALKNTMIFMVLSIGFAGSSYYVTYYQSTNLSVEDTQNISDGFYYVRDLKEELENLQSGQADVEGSKQTITFIVTSLAGYSVKKAKTLNTVDGQLVLNRYYTAMSELGINVSRQSSQLFSDTEVVSELLKDTDKVLGYQRKALTFFKIDESMLQAEK